MNGMFNWTPSPGEPLASPYLYVYFVVTLPLTILIYLAWWWWFRYTQKHAKVQYAEGINDIEKRLKMATRSATGPVGTW